MEEVSDYEKEKAMNEITGEFEKRLSRYCDFESVVNNAL